MKAGNPAKVTDIASHQRRAPRKCDAGDQQVIAANTASLSSLSQPVELCRRAVIEWNLLVEYARRARLAGHVVPPWLVEEAWRFAWDAELGPGRLEEVEGAALRGLSMRVRKRARQMTRDTMDALYPRPK